MTKYVLICTNDVAYKQKQATYTCSYIYLGIYIYIHTYLHISYLLRSAGADPRMMLAEAGWSDRSGGW